MFNILNLPLLFRYRMAQEMRDDVMEQIQVRIQILLFYSHRIISLFIC